MTLRTISVSIRPRARKSEAAWPGWPAIAVLVSVALLSILPLLWFSRHSYLYADNSWYLLSAQNIRAGRGYTVFGDLPLPLRGPIISIFLAILMIPFADHPYRIVWAMRILALANPLLIFLMVRRLSSPLAAAIAAGLVTFFGYVVLIPQGFTVDAFQLTLYLTSLLTLLAAMRRNSGPTGLLSGVLLGVTILTKETALASLPLALVAALSFGWNLRGAVWHYCGVLLACLPWWVWVWTHTHTVYLLQSGEVHVLGNQPVNKSLVLTATFATLLPVLAGLGVYRARTSHWTLNGERTRHLIGWGITLVWTVMLSVLVTHARTQVFSRGLSPWEYLERTVLPATPLWYLIPPALLYLSIRAFQGSRTYGLYVVLYLCWVPLVALLLLLHYNIRQWLVPQTLAYGAISILVADAILLAGRNWSRIPPPHLPVRPVYISLVSVLLAAVICTSVPGQAARFLSPTHAMGQAPSNYLNRSVRNMHDWIGQNVPARDGIMVYGFYRYVLAFLDGNAHRISSIWVSTPVNLSKYIQAQCTRHQSTSQLSCPRSRYIVWARVRDSCEITSLSSRDLVGQMENTSSGYLLLTARMKREQYTEWVKPLIDTGAFRIEHISPLLKQQSDNNLQGAVLLKLTHLEPETVPASMDSTSMHTLRRCVADQPGGTKTVIRNLFPQGVQRLRR